MAERIPEFSERAVALKRQLTKDPFNIDAWNALMTEAHSHRNVADIRSCFEALVAQFPTSSKQWIGYIQFEQQQENKRRQQQQQQQQQRFASGANASAASDSDSGADYVGNVFQRSVFNVRTVDLWTEYVQHVIAKHKPLAGHSGQMVYVHSEHEPNHVILQAYSFALQNVGLDPEAGRLWSRFARCIWKDFKGDTPYNEQERIKCVRKVYRDAVKIPTSLIEELWHEYDMFEHEVDRQLARKNLSEASPAYMTARSVVDQLTKLRSAIVATRPYQLEKYATPVPPVLKDDSSQSGSGSGISSGGSGSGAGASAFQDTDARHLAAWKRYILWEQSNPLRIADVDLLKQRISLAYHQSLLALRYFPEAWCSAAMYFASATAVNQAAVERVMSGAADATQSANSLQRALEDASDPQSLLNGSISAMNLSTSAAPNAVPADLKEACTVMQEACEALPRSLVVHFLYAELEEARGGDGMQRGRQAYEALTERYKNDVAALISKRDAKIAALSVSNTSKQPDGATAEDGSDGDDAVDEDTDEDEDGEDEDGDEGDANDNNNKMDIDTSGTANDIETAATTSASAEARQSRAAARRLKAQEHRIRASYQTRIDTLLQASTLAWIHYVRYVRRTQDAQAARRIFVQARNSKAVLPQIYIAGALIEFHINKATDIAGRIFEKGMTEFGDDPAYALEYLRHLVSIHDVIKARAAFEEALTRVPVAKQRSLWQLMASYERTYGDFGAIQRIEQRFIEAFPGEDLSRRLLNKFTTAGLTSYIGPRELGIPCVAESAVSGRRSLLDDGGSGSGGGGGDEQDDGTGLQSILLNDDEERGRMGGKKRPGVILTTGYWAKELNKAELLAPVSRGRGLKPDASKWRPFRPSAEDTRSAYRFGAVSAQEAANAQRLPPVPAAGPPPPLLDPNRPTGFARDPLSAIVAALPAQPYAFNGPPLNIEEMLSIISREVPNRTLQFIMEGAHPERAGPGGGNGAAANNRRRSRSRSSSADRAGTKRRGGRKARQHPPIPLPGNR